MKKSILKKTYALVIVLAALSLTNSICFAESSRNNIMLSPIETLGKYVFFDKISTPSRMACVTCHDPETGGTGSISGVNQHEVAITGANPHTIGNLKPPTNAYATFIRPFEECNSGGLGGRNVCGGNFWNGRAEGNEIPLSANGATKHIGEEVFYASNGIPLDPIDTGVWLYTTHFGPTADQALNPMPNKVEQNIDRLGVCLHVENAKYAKLYEQVWGVPIDCSDNAVTVQAADVNEEKAFDISFKRLMLAVCAWQSSPDLNSFSSKRDQWLRAELACLCQDNPEDPICDKITEAANPAICVHVDYQNSPGKFPLVGFTDEENYGHDLFYATRRPLGTPLPNGKFSNCAFCHSDDPGLDTGAELKQVYSAQDYHNIGTPKNQEIPISFDVYGQPINPDIGVADHMGDTYPLNFWKTPTLRNVDKRKGIGFTKAYTHNGWFKSMESIVHFYNTAFVKGKTAANYGITRCPEDIVTEKDALANNCWPAPAYGLDDGGPSAIPFIVGDLRLEPEDEAALVAYLRTLTDSHSAKAPRPYNSNIQ